MAINPITFANRVNRQFLRYQMTSFPLSDKHIADQANTQILGEHGSSPLVKGPYVSLSRAYKMGPAVSDLVEEGKLHPAIRGIAQYPNVFKHQAESLDAVQAGNHVIVSTGTGSGKTEAFLYPILNDCLKMRDNGEKDGVTAVIVYPMNALAVDQLDRMRDMLAGTGISFGMYVGTTPANESELTGQVKQKQKSREAYIAKKAEIARKRTGEVLCPFEERMTESEMRESPPRILLTNYNQLEILLTRGKDLGMFQDAPLKYLVFDEAHTYSGVKGAEVSLLIRRIRTFAGKTADEVTCIGTSATIHDKNDPNAGTNFASRFFGIDRKKVSLVEETYEDQTWAGTLYTQPPFTGDESFLDQVIDAIEKESPEDIVKAVTILTGQTVTLSENWQADLHDHFRSSSYVKTLFEKLQKPTHLNEAIDIVAEALGRPEPDPDSAKVELLATLALCGAALKNDDPLLRPKLHFFVHGLQGAIGVLSTGREHQTSVHFYMSMERAVTEHNDRMPASFYNVFTCRVCGQHAMETFLDGLNVDAGELTGGNAEGDNVFWPAGTEGEGTRILFTNKFAIEDEDVDASVEDRIRNRTLTLYVCQFCGTMHQHEDHHCSNEKCARDIALLPIMMLIPRPGESHVGCPSCNTRPLNFGGMIREPFRNFRAITVADVHILSQDILNAGENDDESLIVFSDNRQDAAFQAGWMQDHARRFRLRHLIYHFLLGQNKAVNLNEIETFLTGLYDSDRGLIKALCPEVFHTHTPQYFGTSTQETLAKYLRIQLLLEFNTQFKHAASLESWGLMRVLYAQVEAENDQIQSWSDQYGIPAVSLTLGITKLLDAWRRNNRVLYDDREDIYTHYWHPSDKEISNGFLHHRDFPPKGLKLYRGGNDNKSLILQVLSQRGVTLAMGFVRKWGMSKDDSIEFLEALWKWLVNKKILTNVQMQSNKRNPLPGSSGAYQINSAMIGYVAQKELFMCNVCHRYHNTDTPGHACTSHHCKGDLKPVEISENDYNISTLLKPFNMVMAQEHSAQVPNQTREQIERDFKSRNGKVNTLIATPTLEMGVDIGDLDMILLRNVPPRSSNYWQRVGRAGRRHRMAVLYTYCRNSDHDNYFFEDPYRLLRAPVDPPRFNLQNGVMIKKHIHAAILSYMIKTLGEMPAEFPLFVDGYLYDEDRFYRKTCFDVIGYTNAIQEHKDTLLNYISLVFKLYWPEDAEMEVTTEKIEGYIDTAGPELQEVVNRLYDRMQWTLKKRTELTNAQQDRNLEPAEERLLKRCTEYLKALKEHSSNSYTLTVLASNGYLPGYGTYTGSVVGHAERFKTTTGVSVYNFELTRPPSMAIREFVPGNLLYANSGKFHVSLFHLPIDHSDAHGDGYVILPDSDKIEIAGTEDGYGDTDSVSLWGIPVSDVDLGYLSRISDEEILRRAMSVKIMGLRKKAHRGGKTYKFGSKTDVHHLKGQEVRLINVGPSEKVSRGDYGYWVCSICGGVRSPFSHEKELQRFTEFHSNKCGKVPEPMGISADVSVDGLLFKKMPSLAYAVNLGETLKRAASKVIEMDVDDLQTLIFPQNEEEVDLFLYDPMPGGSGLLQQIIDLWSQVQKAGLDLTSGCQNECESSCYSCLRSYRNIFYHEILDRHQANDILAEVESITIGHDIPENIIEQPSDGENTLRSEERLEELLIDAGYTGFTKQFEIPLTIPGYPNVQRTTPDFVFENHKVAVYLDGMSRHIHGNPESQIIDRVITDELTDELAWKVIRIQVQELNDETVMSLYYRKLSRFLA